MKRTGELQPIVKENYALGGNVMSAAELYAMHEKQRAQPIRLDMAGPKRITNASMPNCDIPSPEYPSHIGEDRLRANSLPSLSFGKRHYRDGRIEDLEGNVLQEASR